MFNCILRLIEPYRSQKWRDAQEQKAFEAIFDDIPSDDDRKNMSEKELAEVLSTCKAGTPAYILVEHELNIRIAGIQSRATLRSGWLGLLGALLGAALGFFLGTLSPTHYPQEKAKLHLHRFSVVNTTTKIIGQYPHQNQRQPPRSYKGAHLVMYSAAQATLSKKNPMLQPPLTWRFTRTPRLRRSAGDLYVGHQGRDYDEL